MKHLCYQMLGCLLGLMWLAGCREAPRVAQLPRQPPAHAATPPPAPLPGWSPPVPTLAQQGHHRYEGTLAGRPVLLELTVQQFYPGADFFDGNGTYYYLNSGTAHILQVDSRWEQPLELSGENGQYWCATQPLGPTLSGTCITGSGQLLGAFRLRERYTHAAHYELLVETLAERPGTGLTTLADTSSITLAYLHLLGRDTLRPALARLQCPVPARRLRARRALAAQLVPTPNDLRVWLQESIDVTLNEADLLAYYSQRDEAYGGSGHGYLTQRNYLLDLRTGRPLHLASELRPGGQRRLRQLLTRHAQRDTTAHDLRDYLQNALLRLPAEDFSLQPAGCDAYYGSEGSHDGNSSSIQETVSWAELRPLLRPHSPLWRLLRARGF